MDPPIHHVIEFPKEKSSGLKDFVPIIEAAIWPLFLFIILFLLRRYVVAIAEAITARIHGGSSIAVGPVSIGEPPKDLPEKGTGAAAVSDSTGEPSPQNLTLSQLGSEYQKLKKAYFLLHATEVLRKRTAPRSGRYRVRVWIESYDDPALNDVARVTYHVWDNFNPPILSTTSQKSRFDLWTNVYGEFPLLAYIERKTGPPITATRYIDLPGRPPD